MGPTKTTLDRICQRTNDWSKAKNALTVVLSFCNKLLVKVKGVTTLTTNSKVLFLLRTQRSAFSDVFKCISSNKTLSNSHHLSSLCPFIGDDNLLRVGGILRLGPLAQNTKHPILLPKTHQVTTMILSHYHCKAYHQGRRSEAIRWLWYSSRTRYHS